MIGGGVCVRWYGYAEGGVGTGAKLGEGMRKWLEGLELPSPPDIRRTGHPASGPDIRPLAAAAPPRRHHPPYPRPILPGAHVYFRIPTPLSTNTTTDHRYLLRQF